MATDILDMRLFLCVKAGWIKRKYCELRPQIFELVVLVVDTFAQPNLESELWNKVKFLLLPQLM